MNRFKVDFDKIYQIINDMELKISEDPLYGGPERIQQSIGRIYSYLDKLVVIQSDATRKLGELKSAIKIQRSKLKILSNPSKYKGKNTDVNEGDQIVDTELKLDEANQLLDPLQALVEVVDTKAKFLKNKDSALKMQWRIMEKQIILGRRPRPASFDDGFQKQIDNEKEFNNEECKQTVDDFLNNL